MKYKTGTETYDVYLIDDTNIKNILKKPERLLPYKIYSSETNDVVVTTFTEVFLFSKDELGITFYMTDTQILIKVKDHMFRLIGLNFDVNDYEITKDANKKLISIYPTVQI